MSKAINMTMVGAALAAVLTATSVPMAAQAQVGSGVLNCDAPGGRQQAGALIGGAIGALAGSRLAKNERTIGAVVGGGAGAAVGSYIGCNQQRGRANAQASSYGQASSGSYRATSNLRVRSGPGTNYGQVGSLSAGQGLDIATSQGEWVQLSSGGWVNANYVTAN